MRTILLIRHAETDLAGRFCGASDPPLNERGRAQTAALAARLDRVRLDGVCASPLRRATETAEPLARSRALTVNLLPGLAEINFGDWEGLSWEEIEQRDPRFAARWCAEFPALPTPGGEPIGLFRSRVLAAMEALRLDNGSGELAVVTHAGVLRVVLEELGHYPAHHAWERTREYTCVIALRQSRPGGAFEVQP